MNNDEIKMSKELLPVKVQEFMDRVPKSEQHGVYHIETIDINGNKTGEAFALNLMTNYGVNRMFSNVNDTGYFYIFIGTGTEAPTLDNNTIRTPFITSSATMMDTNVTQYPSKYNKKTHILTQRYKRAYGYFDYNYSGVTENVEITEIGIGNSYNSLKYHSYVCDSEGNQSSITKRPNERLYITAYVGACVNVDLMKQKWDEGIYLFVNPYAFAFGQNSYYYLYLSVGRRNKDDSRTGSKYYPHSSYYKSSNTINTDTHILQSDTINLDVGIMDKTDHMYYSVSTIGSSSVLYEVGYTNSNMNFFAFTFEEIDKETTPIEDRTLTTIDAYTNSYTSDSFSDLFGLKSYKDYTDDYGNYFEYSNGELPCVNFDIQSLTMYNHLTKEWDIEESYINNPNMDYNYIWAYTSGTCYIENFSHNGGMTIRVFINPHTEWELYAFNTSGITIYGSDEWWDVDTYIKIPDITNLPSDARNCRYYIITSGSASNIYPQYNITGREDVLFTHQHMVKPMDNLTIPSNVVSSTYEYYRPVSSDVNNWFCTSNQLVYSPTETDAEWHVYTIKAYDDSSISEFTASNDNGGPTIFRYNTDDRLCIGSQVKSWYAGTGWRIYDTSDRNTEPTYIDIALSTSDSSEYTKGAFISFTNNGFIVRQSMAKSSSEIINIYGYQDDEGDTIYTETLQNTSMCFALNLTDNCVYRKTDADVPGTFEIYDMRNKIVIGSFTLPTENTYTYNNVFGWREFIYISATITSSSSTKTYFYNCNEPEKGVTELNISINMPKITDNRKVLRADLSVSECYIISSNTNDNHCKSKLVSADNPTSFKELSYIHNDYIYSNKSHRIGQLKYINNGKQLIYCTSPLKTNNLIVFDIGYILDNGSSNYAIPYSNFPKMYIPGGRYSDIRSGFACIYNNGIILSSAYGGSGKTNDVVKWFPIERFLHHRMSGTTTTLNTFNNPIKLTGKTWNFSVSNHMDTILGVSNTTETLSNESET